MIANPKDYYSVKLEENTFFEKPFVVAWIAGHQRVYDLIFKKENHEAKLC